MLYSEVGSAVSLHSSCIRPEFPLSNILHSRPSCRFLALPEPGPILPKLEEDNFDNYECFDFPHFLRYRKSNPVDDDFLLMGPIAVTLHGTNTLATVWIRPLGVGRRDSRRFGFQQLVLC